MSKSNTRMFVRRLAPALLILALPLAGCVADQWAADEEPLVPYGGSKTHVIKVVGNKAIVDECGQWPVDSTDSDNNTFLPNHGCAVQANIGAMAAYPQDLVRARKIGRAPAESRVAAVRAISAPPAASSGASTGSSASASTKP